MFSEKIMNRFTNPINSGFVKKADGVGSAGNVDTSDVVRIYLKVENNKIVDAKFKAFGCVIAIASSDVVIDLIKNKNVDEAIKITSKDISNILGEVDDDKKACQNVAIEALHLAVENYKENILKLAKKKLDKKKEEENS